MSRASFQVAHIDNRQGPDFLRLLRTGYFHRQQGHHMHRDATHDYLLFWVLEGQGTVASEQQLHHARPGDVILLDKGPMQEYTADAQDPWSIVWAHFDGHLAADFFNRIRQSSAMAGRIAGHLGFDAMLRSRFNEMMAHARAQPVRHAHLCACLLAAVLAQMAVQLDRPSDGADPRSLHDLAGVMAHIDQHLDHRLTVEGLAAIGKISPRQLTRRFRQAVGTSPLQYILRQRVAKAAMLLSQTDLPIKQVGQAVGCDDPYYFSRLFRQATRVSPLAYRRSHRRR